MSGLSWLFDHRLPINRKERYYTGTVLPMIVASDGFKHFGEFLALCGVEENVALDANPDSSNVQFFTEYGFEESRMGGAEDRFERPLGRYAPDLVVYVESEPSLLLGVEAKFFSMPSETHLEMQLKEQEKLLSVMGRGMGTQPLVRQVALLPEGLGMPHLINKVPVLTWEMVANTFRCVAPPYWIGVLDLALRDWDRLASQSGRGGVNCDARITGKNIVDGHRVSDPRYTWMGRRGGLNGSELQEDLEDSGWKNRRYEVRREPLCDNPNWFPIADFVEKIRSITKPPP